MICSEAKLNSELEYIRVILIDNRYSEQIARVFKRKPRNCHVKISQDTNVRSKENIYTYMCLRLTSYFLALRNNWFQRQIIVMTTSQPMLFSRPVITSCNTQSSSSCFVTKQYIVYQFKCHRDCRYVWRTTPLLQERNTICFRAIRSRTLVLRKMSPWLIYGYWNTTTRPGHGYKLFYWRAFTWEFSFC